MFALDFLQKRAVFYFFATFREARWRVWFCRRSPKAHPAGWEFQGIRPSGRHPHFTFRSRFISSLISLRSLRRGNSNDDWY
jgi:hypothetical protein